MHLTSDEFIQNPYPSYRQLRQTDGGHWLAVDDGAGAGMWLFSRYADVSSLLREATQISKVRAVTEDRSPFDYMMLSTDPPLHRRLRELGSPAFAPERLLILEQQLRVRIDTILDVVLEQGSFDFARDVALPIPLFVVGFLLGVPEQDTALLHTWTDELLLSFDSTVTTASARQKQEQCIKQVQRYCQEQLARNDPPQGSALDVLAKRRGEVTEGEALGLCLMVLLAGYETTVGLLGNGLLALLHHPEQLQLLREQPPLLDAAIEEMLRYDSALQRTTFRVARSPIEIGGRLLEPGTQVAALLGAANRDERQFENPDRFEIGRTSNRHIAFGVGVHRCLGERVARLEARLVFSRLLERTRNIELASEPPRWWRSTMFRSLRSLPVRVTPR